MLNRYEEKALKFAHNYSIKDADKDTNMELAQVFANNIQVGQFKKVVPQYEWNTQRFEEERAYFLWWLINPRLGGRYNFKDQITAWETYELSHVFEEVDDDEEFTPSWMEEIELAINNAVRAGNYSETGGQL